MPTQARRRGLDALGNIEDWMARRTADVHRLANGAEAAGREAWSQATRSEHDLVAKTTAQVRALGARIQSGAHPVHPRATSKPNTARPGWGTQIVDQALAGARGAQDSFTFGLGDRGYAGIGALIDAADGGDVRNAYHRRMEVERARDRYDEQHYGMARGVGEVAGAVAQLPALGWIEGPAIGIRMAESAPLLLREARAVAGAGAAAGVGGQAVTDVGRGHIGSFGDYLGAAAGGAAGSVGSLFGAARYAGALDGATTSVAQDLLNNRRPSVSRAVEVARAGGVFGAIGGRIGSKWADNLGSENPGVRGEIKAKGDLGEDLSKLRLLARGDRAVPGPKSRAYLQAGGYTYPDLRTALGELIESKFGRAAELSRRQRQAYQQPLDNYNVFHFIPDDVGRIVGFPASLFGTQAALSKPPEGDAAP